MSQNYAVTSIAQIIINKIWQYKIDNHMSQWSAQDAIWIWDWVQNVSKLCHNINCTNHNKENMAIQNRQSYVSIIYQDAIWTWDWVQNVSKLCHNINCATHNKQNMAIQSRQSHVPIICPRCYMNFVTRSKMSQNYAITSITQIIINKIRQHKIIVVTTINNYCQTFQ